MRNIFKHIMICTSVSVISVLTYTGCQVANAETSQPKTFQTQALLQNIKVSAEKGYMFGHHDATVYGIGWENEENRSDVKSVCGDYPAVISFDLGHIEHKSDKNLDNVAFEKIRQEIINQYKRGGVISLSWHVDNPVTGGDSWDNSDSTVVSQILSGGPKHDMFQEWLTNIAGFFNSLVTDNGEKIPVFFRPWHEHSGNWFWWGQDLCSVEEYKALWDMTDKKMRECGVDNILYSYSPNGDVENFMEKYPGDEYIDLLGFDIYQRNDSNGLETFTDIIKRNLALLDEYCTANEKLYAITEIGYETVSDSTWWTNVLDKTIGDFKPCYVLVWRNAREKGESHYYAPYPGQVSVNDFIEFYKSPKTLFLNDVADLYK